ncbi:PREDICTED: uncharacterized protein LOC108973275 [Bactrocera latifrons]|uniref:uncharacterized protein LOC108973275 n=1 Tax=Bactrocera latifrons TaxID=174628 RepID=UPI0008DE9926|nr:PREDICTED: uncharacterized protein LOC108973275 [Bactrocera latifrons]
MHVTHAARDGCQTLSNNSSIDSDNTRKNSANNHLSRQLKNNSDSCCKNSSTNDINKRCNTTSDGCNTQHPAGILRHSCHIHNRPRNDNHPHFAIDNLEKHRFFDADVNVDAVHSNGI